MNYKDKYKEWLTEEIFDEQTKDELRNIKDEKEIEDRFYKELAFGTGGLRGVIGAGTNRMNIYTVRKATQGLANYIVRAGQKACEKGVVIAYDSRRFSPEFADEAARVLAANGIMAYVFESLRPTPVLSYAVRKLGTMAGIVVTASHNPPEYNGYKVYWEDGAQITEPHDVEIINEVNNIIDYNKIKTMSQEKAQEKGLYKVISSEIDEPYIDELKKLIIDNKVMKQEGKKFTIVYTPLHGTGNIPVRRILKEIGFDKVYVVKEQEKPDGEFPTVSYPNPEDIKVYKLALELAQEVDADIIMATDPDADRLGVLAKTPDGEFKPLTGNNIGMLLMEYQIRRKQELGILPKNGSVVTTIVSTYMTKAIAKDYNIKLFETLTGFKYIGEKIKQFEENNSYEYLFGFEESYGALIGTHARDKDAVVAVMGVAELACYYKSKGLTLYEALIKLFEKYGYYKEDLSALTLKGKDGAEKIEAIMDKLRNDPPSKLAGLNVNFVRDYNEDTIKKLKTGEMTKTGLPKSNVLYFDLDNDAWIAVRPSGTEPKIKFYFGIKANSLEDAEKLNKELKEATMALVE